MIICDLVNWFENDRMLTAIGKVYFFLFSIFRNFHSMDLQFTKAYWIQNEFVRFACEGWLLGT